MEIRLEDRGGWKRQLAITIPAERVEQEMNRVVETYRRKVALPGFRKGKAPSEIIKVRYESDLEADLLNDLIPDAFEDAVRQNDLHPVGPPRFHQIRFAVGEPLRFLVDFEVSPQVEIRGYRDLAVDQEIIEVDDGMIAEVIENLRESRATFTEVDRPSQEGDMVSATLEPIDVHGHRLRGTKREDVRMEAGSPNLLVEFREASLGLTRGAERMIEVHYPERFGDRELAGKIRRFRLIARAIEEKRLPELDDDFARSIDFHLDMEGLKAKIRLRRESEELLESKRRLEETLQDRLVDSNPIDVPEFMMAHSLDVIVQKAREEKRDFDEAALRDRFRPIVERMHRRNLVLQNVARQESLSLSDEEIEAELDSIAQDAGVEVSVLRRKMEDDGEIDRLRDTLRERKILDFLVSNARINRVRRSRPRPEEATEASRIITP